MQSLQDIPELDPTAIELLEAAGYFDVTSLKEHGFSEIYEEIVKANNVLEITPEPPTSDEVMEWLKPLEDQIGAIVDDTAVDPDMLVSERELLSASFAIPLSKQFLDKNDVSLDELLVGNVKFTSELSAKENLSIIGSRKPTAIKDETDHASKVVNEVKPVTETSSKPVDELLPEVKKEDLSVGLFEDSIFTDKKDTRINKEKIISMETFREKGSHIEPLISTSAGDLTRATRQETNAGVDPSSRKYVRGVLHKRAAGFKFSIFAYFMCILCFLAGVLMPLLMLVDKQKFEWAIWSPLLIIVALLIYLMFTGRAQCPICNQKQFAPKRCLKHRNAHHSGLFGYMLPTALHAFMYKWFRCIFCGTSVRLKE